MYNMRRATLICVLIISIFSLVLFTCPFAYAQSHKLSDECWNKAEELQKQGKYLDAAEMYEKFVEAEKASPSPRMEGLAPALISTGYCYYLIGQYDRTLKYFKEAQAVAEKLGQEGDISTILNNIGNVYYS
jgi:tetratricopeptide (TPR) repeat protein